MKPFPRRRIVVVLVAFACMAGGVWLFRESRTSYADAEWLSSRPPPRRSRLEFLGRWMWPVKRQILRWREKIIGPVKAVELRGLVVEIDPDQPLPVSQASASFTNRSGEALFVFPTSEFAQVLRKTPGVQVLSMPRMSVGDGMQAQMAITDKAAIGTGTNMTFGWVGWWMDIQPSVRGSAVDLACFITSAERAFRETGGDESSQRQAFIRTNVAFGVRVTVPTNGTLFLLSHSTNQNGKVLGAALSPGIQKR